MPRGTLRWCPWTGTTRGCSSPAWCPSSTVGRWRWATPRSRTCHRTPPTRFTTPSASWGSTSRRSSRRTRRGRTATASWPTRRAGARPSRSRPRATPRRCCPRRLGRTWCGAWCCRRSASWATRRCARPWWPCPPSSPWSRLWPRAGPSPTRGCPCRASWRSPWPRRWPTACTAARTCGTSSCTTLGAARWTCRSCTCPTAAFPCTPRTATRSSAARTLTTASQAASFRASGPRPGAPPFPRPAPARGRRRARRRRCAGARRSAAWRACGASPSWPRRTCPPRRRRRCAVAAPRGRGWCRCASRARRCTSGARPC
mmetsp:Transcript_10189/g.34700  ORF Transcript_10189/g.34700 Transcript_10189/m.34700 type:complete len:315 (+) Transcript_10189:236-1180(+)